MKSFDELNLEQLTLEIENNQKKWSAISRKLMQSNDPVERIDLEERKQEFEREIKSLEKRRAELEASLRKSAQPSQEQRESKDKVQIFISYAREDQDRIRLLYDRLLAAGYAPWLDREHLLPGQDWEQVIHTALRDSDFALVCLSATSINKRGFLQKEIKQALDQAKEKLEDDVWLIPARLDDCKVPQNLSAIQWVDLFKPDGFDQLLLALAFQLKKMSKAVPVP